MRSRTFHERNKVADILAALARESGVWFASLPCFEAQVGFDFCGTDFFHFDTQTNTQVTRLVGTLF